MRMLMLAVVGLFAMTAPTYACSPTPSCWMQETARYMRGICRSSKRSGRTLKDIERLLDEPEKIEDFARACKKLGVDLGRK